MERATLVARLAAAGCVAPEEEADELVAAAPAGQVPGSWVARREDGEPLPWITGRVRFADRRMRITPGVYVPRPQTEELARRAAALLAPDGCAVDLCTGAGAVAAHLRAAVPGAAVVGLDVDPLAAACARSNGVPTVVGDVARAAFAPAHVDLVTAVAPYVPTPELAFLPADVQRHEPRRALDGGDDGLDLVRAVVVAAAGVLRDGGWLVTEVGGDQDRWLGPALAAVGFDAVAPWWDEDGDLRGIEARFRAPAAARSSR